MTKKTLLLAMLAGVFPLAASAAKPTPPELEIPFKCGAQHDVTQAAGGPFSHAGTDMWAWDFRAPVGTPVVAAYAGVVRMTRADSTRGGCDRSFGPDANYVIVEHGDGLETQYLHLSRVDVAVGEKVRAGDKLGEVGETGFSCGSHLHFQMQRTEEGSWANQSVPATFRGLGEVQAGQRVVSRNCGERAEPTLVG